MILAVFIAAILFSIVRGLIVGPLIRLLMLVIAIVISWVSLGVDWVGEIDLLEESEPWIGE